MNRRIPVALTVAGSDTSGGAGIQADLKTFTAMGVYGQSVITSLTAQNIHEVSAVKDMPPEFIKKQFDALRGDLGFNAVKTGMLSNRNIVKAVAGKIRQYKIRNFVLDPVLVSTSGKKLLNKNAISLLKKDLVPLSLVITPNIPEAEVLTGMKISGSESVKQAAAELIKLGCKYVLIKGGHRRDNINSNDLLFDGKKFTEFRAKRVHMVNLHGTGCTFSAAICAGLAKGNDVEEAVRKAKSFITQRTPRRRTQFMKESSNLKIFYSLSSFCVLSFFSPLCRSIF